MTGQTMDGEQEKESTRSGSRIQLVFTREGWIYLTVLLFIASGALLRNINLLILLTGLMIAPLLVGWRLAVSMLFRLSGKRSFPRIGFVNKPMEVTWEMRNERQLTGAWQLVLRDQCQPVQIAGRWQKPQAVRLLFQTIRPGDSAFQSYKIVFDKRGEYQFGPVLVTTRFPFGLIQTSFKIPGRETLFVAPALGKLTTSWDRRLLSRATGQSSIKRKRGLQDDEFFALRGWRSGDSIKQVHWRTTAKYSQPMVKQFDARTDKDFVMILDLYQGDGAALSPPVPPAARFNSSVSRDKSAVVRDEDAVEQILSFGSTVFTGLQGNLFGQIALAICGQELAIHSDHVFSRVAADVLKSLALAQPTPRPQTARAILEAGRFASEGTPLYVFSSREFPPDLLHDLSPEDLIRFRKMEPWIRWVSATSLEFREIFQSDPDSDSLPLPPTQVGGTQFERDHSRGSSSDEKLGAAGSATSVRGPAHD